jgi:hypothetical protein
LKKIKSLLQNGEEKNRIERLGGPLAPIWGVSFCPLKEDDSDIFVTVDWTQALSFYDSNGKQVISYTKILYLTKQCFHSFYYLLNRI